MRSFLTGAVLLSGLASAVPTLPLRVRDVPSYAPLNITYSSSSSSSNNALPNTLVIATGGTIAGSSASSSDATHYQSGVVGVAALVQGK